MNELASNIEHKNPNTKKRREREREKTNEAVDEIEQTINRTRSLVGFS